MRRRVLSVLLPLSVSVLLVFVVGRLVGIRGDLVRLAAGRLTTTSVLVIASLFALTILLRSLRLVAVFGEKLDLREATKAVLLQQMLASLVPFAGRFSLPFILKRCGIARAHTLGCMIVVHVLDAVGVVLVLGLLLLLPMPRQIENHRAFVAVAVAAATFLVLGGLAVLAARRFSFHLWFDRWSSSDERVPWLLSRIRAVDAAVTTIRPTQLAAICAWSLPVVVSMLVVSVVTWKYLLPEVEWLTMSLVSSGVMVAAQLPIQGVAGIGTTHAYAAGFFSFTSLSDEVALGANVVAHALGLVFVTLAGLIGVFWHVLSSPGRSRDPDVRRTLSERSTSEQMPTGRVTQAE